MANFNAFGYNLDITKNPKNTKNNKNDELKYKKIIQKYESRLASFSEKGSFNFLPPEKRGNINYLIDQAKGIIDQMKNISEGKNKKGNLDKASSRIFKQYEETLEVIIDEIENSVETVADIQTSTREKIMAILNINPIKSHELNKLKDKYAQRYKICSEALFTLLDNGKIAKTDSKFIEISSNLGELRKMYDTIKGTDEDYDEKLEKMFDLNSSINKGLNEIDPEIFD